MFIILFGLLGVAALLEVGRAELSAASRLDRAMACGHAALAEVRIRRMHDPNSWVARYDTNNPYTGWFGAPFPTPQWATVPTYETTLQHYQAYVIDPLYIARFLSENPGANPTQIAFNTARFPYGTGAPLYMGRCSYVIDPSQSDAALLFDRLCMWHDDQVFDIPKDPQERPTRLFDSGGVGQFEGNYSWLATVCPVPAEAGQTVANRSLYEVSVVVFHQRDFSPPGAPLDPDKPGERWLTVEVTGGGLGGGDVTLYKQPADPAAWLDVRANDWIMLGGRQQLTVAPPTFRNVFKWYRIIAVESQDTAPANARRVTLAGPDWSADWRADTNGDGNINLSDGSVGVVCTGVAGVYTEMMKLDH